MFADKNQINEYINNYVGLEYGSDKPAVKIKHFSWNMVGEFYKQGIL